MTEPALELSAQPASPAHPGPAAATAADGWPESEGTAAPDGTAAVEGASVAEGAAADGMVPAGAREATPDTGEPPIEAVPSCTQAQLRRFIKSRPYVPLHELRRRFGLNGEDDDVAPMDLEDRRVFVGLPSREAGLLGELLRHGEVGYELLLDPTSPLVIGVFPMRPVQRA